MINLTETAAEHIKKMMAARQPVAKFLRCGVKSGGCSGMEYVLDFEVEAKGTDKIFSSQGVDIVCHPEVTSLLEGLQVDFKDTLVGGGLQFNNPNAARSCGCGTSFNVATELTSM